MEKTVSELRELYQDWLLLLVDVWTVAASETGWKVHLHQDELHLFGPRSSQIKIKRRWNRAEFVNVSAETRKSFEPEYEWVDPCPSYAGYQADLGVREDIIYAMKNTMDNALEDALYWHEAMKSREMPADQKH